MTRVTISNFTYTIKTHKDSMGNWIMALHFKDPPITCTMSPEIFNTFADQYDNYKLKVKPPVTFEGEPDPGTQSLNNCTIVK